MPLYVNLGQAMKEANVNAAELAKTTGLNREHIAEIRDGQFQSISRDELRVLWAWTLSVCKTDLFSIRPDPIWKGIGDSRPLSFILGNVATDSDIQNQLLKHVVPLGVAPKNIDVKEQPYNADQIAEFMTTRNCIFIGGPRWDPKSQFAVELLYRVDQARVPVRFATIGWRESEWVVPVDDGDQCGLVATNDEGHEYLLKVDYILDDGAFTRWSGRGLDGGLLIVCRKPLGTREDVVTIILAGFSGLATREIARELTLGVPTIEEADLVPGQPQLRLMMVPFSKKVGQTTRTARPGGKWFKVDEAIKKWPHCARLVAHR